MRIVVTGKTGQIATALLDAAAAAGVEVIAVGRPECDLADPASIAGSLVAVQPDCIVNAAAYTAVDAAEADEAAALAINGVGAGAVAQAAVALGVPIIQISTDYVFDGSKPTRYLEDDPVCPINAYGASKLAGEEAVRAATDNHAILRTSWVYSAGGKNFLRTMLQLAEMRDVLTIVHDQHGAPSYAPDLALAIIAVARNLTRRDDAELRGTFHMAGGGETTWADFAQEIFRLSAAAGGPSATVQPIATSAYPTPAKRPENSRLDCSKLAKVHGAVLPEWRDGLQRCMNGMRPQ